MFKFRRKRKEEANVQPKSEPTLESMSDKLMRCIPGFIDSALSFVKGRKIAIKGIDIARIKGSQGEAMVEQLDLYDSFSLTMEDIEHYMVCTEGIRDYKQEHPLPEIPGEQFLKMEEYAKKNWRDIITRKISPDKEILGDVIANAIDSRKPYLSAGMRRYWDDDHFIAAWKAEMKQEAIDYANAQTDEDNLLLWLVRLYAAGILVHNFHLQHYKAMKRPETERHLLREFAKAHMDEHGSFCGNDGTVLIPGLL